MKFRAWRKKLAIVSVVVIIVNVVLGFSVLFKIYDCVGSDSTASVCSDQGLTSAGIMIKIMLFTSYLAFALLLIILVSWLRDKSKKP